MSTGNSPESLSPASLVGTISVGSLGAQQTKGDLAAVLLNGRSGVSYVYVFIYIPMHIHMCIHLSLSLYLSISLSLYLSISLSLYLSISLSLYLSISLLLCSPDFSPDFSNL